MKRVLIPVLVVAALFVAGCGGSDPLTSSSVTGLWGGASETPGPHLELRDGGELFGNDGCNSMFGQWEIVGEEIQFSGVGSTMMACEGVDTWLNGLFSAKLDDNALVILAEDGAELGTLPRASAQASP